MGSSYGKLTEPNSEQVIWDCCRLPSQELKSKFQESYPKHGHSLVTDLDLIFQNYLHVDPNTSGLAVKMLAENGDDTMRNCELYRIWERIEEGKEYLTPAFLASGGQAIGCIPARVAIEILLEAFSEFDQERVRSVADYFIPTFPLPDEKHEPVDLDKLVFVYAMTHLDQDRLRSGAGDLNSEPSGIFDSENLLQNISNLQQKHCSLHDVSPSQEDEKYHQGTNEMTENQENVEEPMVIEQSQL